MSENNANIVALIGATGQGKSATFKQWLKASPPARLMLWDPMDEYSEHAKACSQLAELVLATKADAFAVRYVPDGEKLSDRFDAFCQIAFARGKLTLAVEELPMVVSASHAPAGWQACTLRGRHQGLVIVALAQRAALIDKHFFSNATRIRCFRLNFKQDVMTMAGILGVDAGRVMSLRPLQYLERDMASGAVTSGELSFGQKQVTLQKKIAKKKVKKTR